MSSVHDGSVKGEVVTQRIKNEKTEEKSLQSIRRKSRVSQILNYFIFLQTYVRNSICLLDGLFNIMAKIVCNFDTKACVFIQVCLPLIMSFVNRVFQLYYSNESFDAISIGSERIKVEWKKVNLKNFFDKRFIKEITIVFLKESTFILLTCMFDIYLFYLPKRFRVNIEKSKVAQKILCFQTHAFFIGIINTYTILKEGITLRLMGHIYIYQGMVLAIHLVFEDKNLLRRALSFEFCSVFLVSIMSWILMDSSGEKIITSVSPILSMVKEDQKSKYLDFFSKKQFNPENVFVVTASRPNYAILGIDYLSPSYKSILIGKDVFDLPQNQTLGVIAHEMGHGKPYDFYFKIFYCVFVFLVTNRIINTILLDPMWEFNMFDYTFFLTKLFTSYQIFRMIFYFASNVFEYLADMNTFGDLDLVKGLFLYLKKHLEQNENIISYSGFEKVGFPISISITHPPILNRMLRLSRHFEKMNSDLKKIQ